MTACNPLKHVGEGDYLLSNNKIIINGKKKRFKALENLQDDDRILQLFHQNPNDKFLGIRLKLYLYNSADSIASTNFNNWQNRKPRRKEKLRKLLSEKQVIRLRKGYIDFNKWLERIGEPPVVLDKESISKTIKNIKTYYNSIGYFDSKVSYTIDSLPNLNAVVNYQINTGRPYIINKIRSTIDSPLIDAIYRSDTISSYLQSGEIYKLKTLKNELNRITTLCRNSGVYTFQRNAINFEVYADTLSKTDNKIDINVIISNVSRREGDSIVTNRYKIHKIKKVNIYIGDDKTVYSDSIKYDNFYIHYKNHLSFRPKALTNGINIRENSIYRDIDRNNTYKHFNGFETLGHTGIEYQQTPHNDSIFVSNIYLSPKKRFSLNINTDISNSVIQDFGINLNTSLLIRNIFRGGELLEISPRGSIGFQKQLNQLDTKIITQYGGDINLSIPKILFPIKTRFIKRNMNPQTQISIGTGFQKNIGLDKQSINATLRYQWSPSKKSNHSLELINIQYIQNLNINNFYNLYSTTYNTVNQLAKKHTNLISDTDLNNAGNLTIPEGANNFLNSLSNANRDIDSQTANNILFRKKRLILNNIISGFNYTYVLNNRQKINDNNFFRLSTRIEFSGNLLGALSGVIDLPKNEQGQSLIDNISFSQYSKLDINFVKYINLNYDNILVIKAFSGIAIPYGNSNTIPFLKSYFAGGPNDNRGWLAYSLGPGSNNALLDFNEANLKLAFNIEYRFPLIGDLKGALFADIGNIWNIWNKSSNDNTVFNGLQSLEDIAISSGLGFRYDLSFLVLRFDFGIKTYNPALQANKRWLSQFNLNDSVLNIAINYPF